MLTSAEEDFRKCLKRLNLHREVSVSCPPSFEGYYVEIRIRIESSEKLAEIISHFALAIEEGKMDRLLNIIKERSTPK